MAHHRLDGHNPGSFYTSCFLAWTHGRIHEIFTHYAHHRSGVFPVCRAGHKSSFNGSLYESGRAETRCPQNLENNDCSRWTGCDHVHVGRGRFGQYFAYFRFVDRLEHLCFFSKHKSISNQISSMVGEALRTHLVVCFKWTTSFTHLFWDLWTYDLFLCSHGDFPS